MIRTRTTVVLAMAQTAIAIVLLLGASGCSDDGGGGGSTPVPTATQASAPPTRTGTTRPTSTSTVAVAVATATASPSPTATPVAGEFAGDYTSTIALEGTEQAHLNLTVAEDDSATGTLEIIDTSGASLQPRSAGAASGFSVSVGLVSLSGSIDPADGTFHFAGNIDGPDGPIPFDLSGTLPDSPGGSGSVSLMVDGQTYSSTISAGAGPTPLPTPGGEPSPTPIAGGCGHGVFGASFSAVTDSNMVDQGPQTMGNVNALSSADGLGSFVWTITASQCGLELGDVSHTIVIQAVGVTTPIQAGTYTLSTATPPFFGVTYMEALYNPLAPANNFSHAWGTTGGTLTLTDAGGGAFEVHVTAPMGEHPLLHSGTGTFDLELTGTIEQVGF